MTSVLEGEVCFCAEQMQRVIIMSVSLFSFFFTVLLNATLE